MRLSSLSGIAVDIGGTKIAIARIEKGVVTQKKQIQTNPDASISSLVDTLTELVESLQATTVEPIGLAVTGRVDDQGIWHAVNRQTLKKIDQVQIASLFGTRLGRTVSVLNDALAGAVAESRFGAGQGVKRLAYITVSTGVGAGFIIDGIPLQSPSGMIGHVGFTSSRYSDRICGCGRSGTVESIASGAAIARSAHELGFSDFDAVAVFKASRNGDEWATDIIAQSSRAIGELIADLVAILDIEKVLLGGSVGLAQGYLEQVVNSQRNAPDWSRIPVTTARLADPVLLGALAAATPDQVS